MSVYDDERKNENRFAAYWSDNLKEITTKHIWRRFISALIFTHASLIVEI